MHHFQGRDSLIFGVVTALCHYRRPLTGHLYHPPHGTLSGLAVCSSSPGNCSSAFCPCGLACSGQFVEAESHTLWPFAPGFFHFAGKFSGSVTWWHVRDPIPFCGYITFSIHSSAQGSFRFLPITSDVAVNLHVRVFMCTRVFRPPEWTPPSGTARSRVTLFNSLRDNRFTGPPAMGEGSIYFHILANLCVPFLKKK